VTSVLTNLTQKTNPGYQASGLKWEEISEKKQEVSGKKGKEIERMIQGSEISNTLLTEAIKQKLEFNQNIAALQKNLALGSKWTIHVVNPPAIGREVQNKELTLALQCKLDFEFLEFTREECESFGTLYLVDKDRKKDLPIVIDDLRKDDFINLHASGLRWNTAGACKPTGGRELKNSMLSTALANTLGLNWHNIGKTEPAAGRLLKHDELSNALTIKTVLTPEQWSSFGIADLRIDYFIQAGDAYFRPRASKLSQHEWIAMGINDLLDNDYVQAGNSFFKPTGACYYKLIEVGPIGSQQEGNCSIIELLPKELHKLSLALQGPREKDKPHAPKMPSLLYSNYIEVAGKYFKPVKPLELVHQESFIAAQHDNADGKSKYN